MEVLPKSETLQIGRIREAFAMRNASKDEEVNFFDGRIYCVGRIRFHRDRSSRVATQQNGKFREANPLILNGAAVREALLQPS